MTRPRLVRIGTDSSGRPIRMTDLEAAWWDEFADACASFKPAPFEPVITQGPWQLGRGASASAGTHDMAGCFDIRTRDLTPEQLHFLIREGRRRAMAVWHRTPPVFDEEHAHGVLGPAHPKSAAAANQWDEYLGDGDGLIGTARDRHWRPAPLVTTWQPAAPKATPNITAALAKGVGREARKRSLRRVVRHGSPKARRAARAWLAAILATEAAQKKAQAARRRLKAHEVRPS